MADFVDTIMDSVKDLIPKTPEEANVASKQNPSGQWFIDYPSGNMFERLHGYQGNEELYSTLVDPKGGETKVTQRSYLGAIAQFIRAMFKYGDDSAKDNDAIYNTREGHPDIVQGGNDTPNTNSLEGSILYTRIENIFEYYSTKTEWMIQQTDGVKELLEQVKTALEEFQTQQTEQNQNQEEQNKNQNTTNQDTSSVLQDLVDKVGKLTKKVDTIDTSLTNTRAGITNIQSTISSIQTDILSIKNFVKMP